MSRSYWRDQAAPVIAEVLTTIGTDDRKKLAAALRDAYPFGDKKWHPYRMWRDEVRRQLAHGPAVFDTDTEQLELL